MDLMISIVALTLLFKMSIAANTEPSNSLNRTRVTVNRAGLGATVTYRSIKHVCFCWISNNTYFVRVMEFQSVLLSQNVGQIT